MSDGKWRKLGNIRKAIRRYMAAN
ncbi:uncharacterized protein METZ01_LOCUS493542, partial [marine metagenome]